MRSSLHSTRELLAVNTQQEAGFFSWFFSCIVKYGGRFQINQVLILDSDRVLVKLFKRELCIGENRTLHGTDRVQ